MTSCEMGIGKLTMVKNESDLTKYTQCSRVVLSKHSRTIVDQETKKNIP